MIKFVGGVVMDGGSEQGGDGGDIFVSPKNYTARRKILDFRFVISYSGPLLASTQWDNCIALTVAAMQATRLLMALLMDLHSTALMTFFCILCCNIKSYQY